MSLSPRRAARPRRHALLGLLGLLPALTHCAGGDPTTTRGPPVTLVALTPRASVERGTDDTVRVAARDLAQQPVRSATISWRSNDARIATVRGTGLSAVVRGERRGSTVVTATLPSSPDATGRTVEIPVDVRGVAALALPADQPALRVTETRSLLAQVTADAGIRRRVRFVLSTAPGRDPIATLTQTSDTSITLTGARAGTATLTAMAEHDTTVRTRTRLTVLPPRTLTLSPTAITVVADSSATVTARASLEAPLPTTVIWRLTPSDRATLTRSDGTRATVRGLTAGTAVLTAISTVDSSLRATATVTVAPRVRRVAVTPATLTLPSGTTQPLSATVTTDGPLPTTVIWTSQDTRVAIVSALGAVTGRRPGQTDIVVQSTADPQQQARATITVVPPTSLSLSPATAAIRLGDRLTLLPTFVRTPRDPTLLWRTSDPLIATVSAQGRVVGRGVGEARLAALLRADTTIRATATVTVRAAVRGLTLAPPSAVLFRGDSTVLTATVTADPGVSTAVRFQSSDPTVASVTTTGRVTALGLGTTTLRATRVADTTVRATRTFTVRARPTTVTISPRLTTMLVPQTALLTATVSGDPGLPLGVQWTRRQPQVVQVDATGRLTALAAGTARLVATAIGDPRAQDSLTITVRTQLAASWTATRLAGPLIEDVVRVSHTAPRTTFAVNSLGDLYRGTGATWTLRARGRSFGTTFQRVHARSATDVMAVGTNGVWVRWTGTTWQRLTTGTTATLHDVTVTSPTHAVAVGASGTVLEWNGTSVRLRTGTDANGLLGVWRDGTTTVAVGESGRAWWITPTTTRPMTTGTSETLLRVTGTASSALVASGTFGTVRRFSGTGPSTAWTTIAPGTLTTDLTAARMVGTTTYLAGDDGVYRLVGSTITPVTTPLPVRWLRLSSASDGSLLLGGQRGVTLTSTSSRTPVWTVTNAAPDLLDVWTVHPTLAWTVGEFGTIWQYTGRAWRSVASPTTATLNAVWAPDGSTGFAVGDNGTALRWTGTAWVSQPIPTTASLYSLMGFSATEVYAGDTDGVIWRWNGTTWTANAVGSNAWWSLHGLTGGALVASNDGATVARRTTTRWPAAWRTRQPTPSGTVAGVWVSPSGTVFAAGSNDQSTTAFFRRAASGSTLWTRLPGVSASRLTSVWGTADDDVYATSDRGELWRFDGTRATAIPTGTSEFLWSVSGTASGGAFAVGYNSTVVVGSQSPPSAMTALRTPSTRRPRPVVPRRSRVRLPR